MKKITTILMAVCITVSVFGQTLLLDPAGDGGFENGNSFADNGWTVENYTESNQNKWWVGSVSGPASGNNAAYISSHLLGWTYDYQIQDGPAGSRVLFWRDITFPAGESKVELTFKLKVNGYPGYDDLVVFVQNSDEIPNTSVQPGYSAVAGPLIPSTTRVCMLALYGDAYVEFSFMLNPHDIGNFTEAKTRRIIFYWRNDASNGSQPPASVDDIQIMSWTPDMLSGEYSIDNTLPTTVPMLHNGQGNFNSFTDAFNHLNYDGFSGAVTFNVSAGQVFDDSPPALTARGTESSPIIIQKSGVGANPVLQPTGSLVSYPYDFGFCISGGRYITFDGIDVDGTHAQTVAEATEYGFLIRNWSPKHGAQYNTIKNCRVTLPQLFNTRFLGCIFSSTHSDQGGFLPASAEGTNSYNKYYNLTLIGSHNGIYLEGSGPFPDTDNEIGVEGDGCQTARNIIKDQVSDIIASPSAAIKAFRQHNIKIFNSDISNVQSNRIFSHGILLERCSGDSEIFNNKVGNIVNTSNLSLSPAVGIEVWNRANDPLIHARVYNNFVFDIRASWDGAPSLFIAAIGIYARVANSSIIEVDNNTVFIDVPGSPHYSLTNFAISNHQNPVIKVRGNVFVNAVGHQPDPATHVCWFTSAPGAIGAHGSVSDYNDLYIASSGTGGFVARAWGDPASTYYKTVSDWSAATGQDANSTSVDPLFLGPADLHATAAGINAYPGFTPQNWVTSDIDCDVRNQMTPHDLGADAFNVPSCAIPTGLTISNIGFNQANIAWTSPVSGVPFGYEWEVRFSGDPGSGQAGLAAAGSTSHPNTSAVVTGLENATQYVLYVRSNCGFGSYSPWSNKFFTTPSCNKPGSLTVYTITQTQASLSWSAPAGSSPSGYQWEIRYSGEPGSGAAGLAASGSTVHPTTTITATSLDPGTFYTAYVRSHCGNSNYSVWISKTFATICENFDLNIAEGFNTSGENTFPDCWAQQFVNGSSPIKFMESTLNPFTTPQEGSRFVWWNSYWHLNGQQTRLVSPPITTADVSDVNVSFYWYNNYNILFSTGLYLQEGVQVQYSTDAQMWYDAGEFIPRHDGSLIPGEAVWNLKTVSLPVGAGNQPTIYIGFKFTSVRGDNCSMDNLTIWSGDIPPTVFDVTGGGEYCENEDGLPVGLNDSETGVTYTLLKNGVPQPPSIEGTGNEISFGNQMTGTYTIEGENQFGTILMNGAAVITELPALPVEVTIEVDQNNVCPGTVVTFTATPVNGGEPSYQWLVNDDPTGDNSSIFSIVPENGDEVKVQMTSSLDCTTGNPATSNTIILIVDSCQPWEWTVTGQVHTIVVPASANLNIYGNPIAEGDWIGVFYIDGNGDEQCGGAAPWDVEGIAVTAYGNDAQTPQKDGFASGESFRWRIFELSSSEEYPATAAYDPMMPHQGSFTDFGLSRLLSLQVMICQDFQLVSGWNSLSSYIIPAQPAVNQLFEPIVNDMVIMRNLTQIYWPEFGINTIGNFNNNSGYVLKMNNEAGFEICGNGYAGKTLALNPGWHYLPVLSGCNVSSMDLFSDFLSDIVIVQELIGTKIFWPAMNVFSLEYLQPGKAYKIKTSAAISLEFPECDTKTGFIGSKAENSITSRWGETVMTPATQMVVFTQSASELFIAGDIIGAFGADSHPYGIAIVDNNHQNQAITLFGDDLTGGLNNGFYDDETVHYKLYRASTGEEFDLRVEYDHTMNATGNFHSGSFAAVIKATLDATGMGEISSAVFSMYPNPASEVVHFSYDGAADESVTVLIYDAKGQGVTNERFTQNLQLNTASLDAGVYFVKISTQSHTEVRKLIIK
jgi:hypothetical protein